MSSGQQHDLRASILSVGDELVSGLTIDTNSAWLSRELGGLGVRVVAHRTIGDELTEIETAIRDASQEAELILISGGIGPTPDDLTREALAAVTGGGLVESPDWLAHMQILFRARGRVMQPGNRKQAGVPQGAELLWNSLGTAAGIRANFAHTAMLFVLPGVPAEMMAMFDQHVRPWVRSVVHRRGGRVMRTLSLHTFGLGESDIAARLGDLLLRRNAAEDLQVGTTASRGVVSIRAYAAGATDAEVDEKLATVEREARQALGDVIFGRDDDTLAGVVGRLLREHPGRPVLRVAESCTGGLLGKTITDIAGSSDYFDRGFITYSNESKTQVLGLPRELIGEHGAVSEPVVAAMANGALRADPLPDDRPGIALSISGIAGPGGGTADKPVGTVCIGLASEPQVAQIRPASRGDTAAGLELLARTFRFVGDRELIRDRSAMMALAILRYHLLRKPMPF